MNVSNGNLRKQRRPYGPKDDIKIVEDLRHQGPNDDLMILEDLRNR